MTEQQKLSIEDFEKLLKETWLKHASGPPRTVTIYPDGYYEPGEPDTDDGPLAVDDVVRWSPLRSSLFRQNPMPERIPYILGIVENITPWDESLEGRVFVRLFFNGAGSWKEREQLRRLDEDQPQLPSAAL
jgi:hypothetical protein